MQVPRDGLVQKLQKLSQSQQSIESVSSFCVFYHKDAKGVVAIWEDEFYKAPNDRKMALLYLANHILQEGRRKGGLFQDAFYGVLPKAMDHVLKSCGDDKMRRSLTRLIAIWEERRVFGTRHIKSFQSLVGGGGGGGGAAAASGGYQPNRKASGGGGGQAAPSIGGDAVAAASRMAVAAAEKRKAFEAAWRPVSGLPRLGFGCGGVACCSSEGRRAFGLVRG